MEEKLFLHEMDLSISALFNLDNREGIHPKRARILLSAHKVCCQYFVLDKQEVRLTALAVNHVVRERIQIRKK